MPFRVPACSVNDLETIVKAYAHKPGSHRTADVAQATRLSPDDVGRSLRFLEDLGIVEGGNEKSATSLGVSLGRAIDHGKSDDVESFWRQSVRQSETLADILTNLRISGGSGEDELAGDILYKAGIKATPRNKRNAKNAVEVLKKSGLVRQDGDKLVLASPESVSSPVPDSVDVSERDSPEQTAEPPGIETQNGMSAPASHGPVVRTVYQTVGGPTIAINIQLELPPATDPVVYDNLFRSLAEHLLPKEYRQDGDDD